MEKKDISHLANLARIKLSDDEMTGLAEDITNILGYISVINDIVPSNQAKKVGAIHNVMREDSDPHEAGVYTEDLLNEAPDRVGQYVRVKKILGNPDNS